MYAAPATPHMEKPPPPSCTTPTITVATPIKRRKCPIEREKLDAVAKNLEAQGSPLPPAEQKTRTAEAKECVVRAKTSLGLSRNLKTEVKNAVVAALDRLYHLVKDSEGTRLYETVNTVEASPHAKQAAGRDNQIEDLVTELREHKAALARCELSTLALTQRLQEDGPPRPLTVNHEATTYASVVSRRPNTAQPPLHSIIVSSEDVMDTSSAVVEKIRIAVDARGSGIKVDRLKKIRDQKVVLGCGTKTELERVTRKIKDTANGLKVEEAKTRDPLVVLTDVLTYNTDADIIRAIKNQNAHLLHDLPAEEVRIAVKYKRRARNNLEQHVVLEVSPKMWQRLTEAGRVHVDLQRIRVYDQSPLVQCTRCLRFGHGKKLCTEGTDLCSHCSGPHLQKDCPKKLAGEPPRCSNCLATKIEASGHNTFSAECPVRRKWDALARSATRYCS